MKPKSEKKKKVRFERVMNVSNCGKTSNATKTLNSRKNGIGGAKFTNKFTRKPKSGNTSKLVEGVVNAGRKALIADKTFNIFGSASKYTILKKSGSTIAGIGQKIKGKTKWLVRFDKPHPHTGPSGVNPHININRKITRVPDPHLQISSTTLSAAGKVQNVLKTLNKYALPLAITIDTVRLGWAIYKDKGIGENTKMTSASIAGCWSGGTAGGYAGGQTGAVIGSLFGPIGTAVGAITGGLIGGFGGAIYGEQGAKNLVKKIISKDGKNDCDCNKKDCKICQKRRKKFSEWSGEDTFCSRVK